MNSEETTIDLIQKVFPGEVDLIDRLWRERVDFRDLCEAYQECSKAYRYWQITSGATSDPTVEYVDLLTDLHNDLLAVLHQAQRAGRRKETEAK